MDTEWLIEHRSSNIRITHQYAKIVFGSDEVSFDQ